MTASERITEILEEMKFQYKTKNPQKTFNKLQSIDMRMDAIVEYLDEVSAKEEKPI